MGGHFDSLGFRVTKRRHLRALVKRSLKEGRPIDSPRGRYVLWSPGAGIEIWVQTTEEEGVVGVDPHFSGQARMHVGLTHTVQGPEASELEGGLHGWADPANDDPMSGQYPFVFDLPDFDLVRGQLSLPRVVTAQLAAFAHELSCHANDAAYIDSQGRDMPFAPESFIPSGLFTPDGKSTTPPKAYAIFSGHVETAEFLRNPDTGRPFHHLLVRTAGGTVDVVADPPVVTGAPVTGGVVSGSFWLSGRLLGNP